MPILDLQRRLAEVGRIRLGRQIESKSGKKHPAALDTFRLTSTDRARIEEAAKIYGGTVTKWDQSPTGIPQWEVITKADRLHVIVPPSAMAFTQNYELWAAGGCQRRCDTVTEFIGEQPCLCDPENRQCEPHTRLSVMMRDLKGLGVWRVDTTGYYAALEIKGQVETLEFFAGQGKPLPAILRLDQRVIKRPEEGTKRFVVPVLDVDVTPGELLMGTVAVEPPRPALTPVPDPGTRTGSIAEQVAGVDQIPSRRRATPIKATGIAPRTVAQRGTRDPWDTPPDRRDDPEDTTDQLPSRCPNCDTANSVELITGRRTEDTWQCRNCGMTDTEAYDKGLGGWRTDRGSRHERHEQTEEEAYAAVEAARDAATTTQDPPRMVTHGQLTKLGVTLSKRGYTDRSPAGVRARLDYCMGLVRQLMPDSPWSSRSIDSSKQLTFDEAHHLIDYLEREEKQAKAVEQQADPQVNTGVTTSEPDCAQPVDEPVNDASADEEYYDRLERENANDDDNNRDAESDQMQLM